MSTLTAAQLAFLSDPPRSLARIATVDADGLPHVVPGGWSYDQVHGELVLGGRQVLTTKRAQHVKHTGVAAVVIDGLAEGPGWRPWAFAVRGRARLDAESDAIRLSVDQVSSWGLDALAGSD